MVSPPPSMAPWCARPSQPAREPADDAEAVAGEGAGQAVRDLQRRRRGRARADDRDARTLGQPSADPQPDGRVRDRRQQAGVSRLVQGQIGQAEPAARVERLSSQALQVAGGVDMVEPFQCGFEMSIGCVGAGNWRSRADGGRGEEGEGDEVGCAARDDSRAPTSSTHIVRALRGAWTRESGQFGPAGRDPTAFCANRRRTVVVYGLLSVPLRPVRPCGLGVASV